MFSVEPLWKPHRCLLRDMQISAALGWRGESNQDKPSEHMCMEKSHVLTFPFAWLIQSLRNNLSSSENLFNVLHHHKKATCLKSQHFGNRGFPLTHSCQTYIWALYDVACCWPFELSTLCWFLDVCTVSVHISRALLFCLLPFGN